ncbi:MAG TPA: FAD-dependent oxidoreductase [Candidatus Paceibacterota bacterium]|nr:FAD-dependent oxidoreductase [Candidatus Paceibacterota bacterium]
MYDLIIVGGGPAGSAAAVYAARKHLKTLLITSEWGGQSVVSEDIQNWIGTPHISGTGLAAQLEGHVEEYATGFVTIHSPRIASALAVAPGSISVTDDKGERHEALTLLIAAGSTRRKLEVPGALEYENKGLTYCASCDGPLFSGQDVVVVGGGNAGFETAAQLAAYCKSVTLLDRNESFRADPVTVEKVLAKPNVKARHFAQIEEILGEQFVTGIRWKHQESGEETLTPTAAVFVEIGLIPNTAWVGSELALDPIKRIIVDPKSQRSSHARVWAAGDCTDGLYHQNNIAAGDAVKALEDIYLAIHAR